MFTWFHVDIIWWFYLLVRMMIPWDHLPTRFQPSVKPQWKLLAFCTAVSGNLWDLLRSVLPILLLWLYDLRVLQIGIAGRPSYRSGILAVALPRLQGFANLSGHDTM